MAGILVATFLVVGAAATHRSDLAPLTAPRFPGWLAGPLAGAGPSLSHTAFELIVVGMCVCYVVAVVWAETIPWPWAAAAIVAMHVILLLGPPLLSPDAGTYLAYARLGALHGIDPYTHGPRALPVSDALHPWVVYGAGPSNYGPPFTLLTYPLARLGVAGGVWALKAIAMLTSLGTIWLVAACGRLRGVAPTRAAFFLALNPVALLYAVGGAHNDLWMMFALMAGVWLTLMARPAASATAGVLAVGLKVSAAPAALFMLLGSPRRRAFIATGAVACVVLAIIVLVGFGDAGVFGDYLRQLYHGEHRFARRYSVPALVGQLLGLGGVHGITSGVRLAATAVLVAWLLALLYRLRRGGDWVGLAGWAQLAILLTTTWLWPWYIVWILPLAALDRGRRLRLAAFLATVFLVATQVFAPLG